MKRYCILLAILLLFVFRATGQQKVGLVLSGGGASALAHVGVIKALEEENIPIDAITGTSMGALIGGLYASGYSPRDIDSLVSSSEFLDMAKGRVPERYKFFFKQERPNASWIELKFFKDSIFQTNLPTNLIEPAMMDLKLMEIFAGPSALANYDMDSLMVPYRAVASDITSKEEVIFSEGPLNKAIRASMSYPFYLNPIRVDGKLLFDGGLYNNFPSDVMKDAFNPDIIIGSTVSANIPPPQEGNVVSQIKNMLIDRKSHSKVEEKSGIIIHPETKVSTFDFDRIEEAIQNGYEATMKRMGTIKKAIEKRNDQKALALKRTAFRDMIPELVFDSVTITGLDDIRSEHFRKILSIKSDTISMGRLRHKYFHTLSENKIKYIYPNAKYNKSSKRFELKLDVEKGKDFTAQFGGNFSSKPINTGFIGFHYDYFGRTSLSLYANSYFGKFYTSVQLRGKMGLPLHYPINIEPMLTLNRWDYFKSSTAFFEDVRPPFLIQNDDHGGLRVGMPAGAKGRVVLDGKYSFIKNEYSQSKDFTSTDTADQTRFRSLTGGAAYERSSLNRKQYATKGSRLEFGTRYVDGIETSIPGSKPTDQDTFTTNRKWVQFKFHYQNYFKRKGNLRFGFLTEAVYSSQPFFNNYKGTILSAPAFQPIPESKTLFLDDFRAYKYFSFGLKSIIKITKNLNIRTEAYAFQPYRPIIEKENKATFGKELSRRYYIGSGKIVYHSPIGPLALSLNYYDNREEPFSFLFNMGYTLFNERSF